MFSLFNLLKTSLTFAREGEVSSIGGPAATIYKPAVNSEVLFCTGAQSTQPKKPSTHKHDTVCPSAFQTVLLRDVVFEKSS